MLNLTSNSIKGKIPNLFPLNKIICFVMANSNIIGNLPDFPENWTCRIKKERMEGGWLGRFMGTFSSLLTFLI